MGGAVNAGSAFGTQAISRSGYRLTAVAGITAGIVSAVGLVPLMLFYAIEVPNSKGGYDLDYANDVSRVVWMLLLIPLAVGLCRIANGAGARRRRPLLRPRSDYPV